MRPRQRRPGVDTIGECGAPPIALTQMAGTDARLRSSASRPNSGWRRQLTVRVSGPATAATPTADESSVVSDTRSTVPFADLGVPSRLVRALSDGGILEPFPIQAATLPDSLAGRDVLGRGRTGS